MQWLKITLEVNAENKEFLLGKLLELGAGGIEEVDPGTFHALLADLPQELVVDQPLPERHQLITHWNVARGQEVLAHLAKIVDPSCLTSEIVSDEDWVNIDTIGFSELRLGTKWILYPEKGDQLVPSERYPIYIRPGQAFGTGLHPTTQLCLELLEIVPIQGGKALDVGTGSGILTIALSRLGFSDLLACDIDPVALEVAAANLNNNGVDAELCWASPSDLAKGGFNLIVANILADVISELAPHFQRLAQPGSLLLAGGIVDNKKDQVVEAVQRVGYRLLEIREKERWVAFLAELEGER